MSLILLVMLRPHSAFAGCFSWPSLGICRMDDRHLPDDFYIATERFMASLRQEERLHAMAYKACIKAFLLKQRRAGFDPLLLK